MFIAKRKGNLLPAAEERNVQAIKVTFGSFGAGTLDRHSKL